MSNRRGLVGKELKPAIQGIKTGPEKPVLGQGPPAALITKNATGKKDPKAAASSPSRNTLAGAEVAERLKVTEDAVRDWLKKGLLKGTMAAIQTYELEKFKAGYPGELTRAQKHKLLEPPAPTKEPEQPAPKAKKVPPKGTAEKEAKRSSSGVLLAPLHLIASIAGVIVNVVQAGVSRLTPGKKEPAKSKKKVEAREKSAAVVLSSDIPMPTAAPVSSVAPMSSAPPVSSVAPTSSGPSLPVAGPRATRIEVEKLPVKPPDSQESQGQIVISSPNMPPSPSTPVEEFDLPPPPPRPLGFPKRDERLQFEDKSTEAVPTPSSGAVGPKAGPAIRRESLQLGDPKPSDPPARPSRLMTPGRHRLSSRESGVHAGPPLSSAPLAPPPPLMDFPPPPVSISPEVPAMLEDAPVASPESAPPGALGKADSVHSDWLSLPGGTSELVANDPFSSSSTQMPIAQPADWLNLPIVPSEATLSPMAPLAAPLNVVTPSPAPFPRGRGTLPESPPVSAQAQLGVLGGPPRPPMADPKPSLAPPPMIESPWSSPESTPAALSTASWGVSASTTPVVESSWLDDEPAPPGPTVDSDSPWGAPPSTNPVVESSWLDDEPAPPGPAVASDSPWGAPASPTPVVESSWLDDAPAPSDPTVASDSPWGAPTLTTPVVERSWLDDEPAPPGPAVASDSLWGAPASTTPVVESSWLDAEPAPPGPTVASDSPWGAPASTSPVVESSWLNDEPAPPGPSAANDSVWGAPVSSSTLIESPRSGSEPAQPFAPSVRVPFQEPTPNAIEPMAGHADLEAMQKELEEEKRNRGQVELRLEQALKDRAENLDAKSEVESLQCQARAAQSELQRLTQQLQATQGQLATAQSELHNNQFQLLSNQSELQAMQSELKKHQTQLQVAQSQVSSLQNQLDAANSRQTHSSSAQSSQKYEALEQELSTTRRALEVLRNDQKRNSAEQARVAEVEHAYQQQLHLLEEKLRCSDQALAAAEKQLLAAQRDNLSLQRERQEVDRQWQQQLDDLRLSQESHREQTALQEEMHRQLLAQKDRELRELQSRQTGASSEEQASAKAELEEYRSKCEEATKRVKTLEQKHSTQIQRWEKELQAAGNWVGKLTEAVQVKDKRVGELEALLSQSQSRAKSEGDNQLTAQLMASKVELASVKRHYETIQQSLQSAEKELIDVKQEKFKLQRELEEARGTHGSSAEKGSPSMQQELRHNQDLVKQLETEVVATIVKLAALEREKLELEARVRELTGD